MSKKSRGTKKKATSSMMGNMSLNSYFTRTNSSTSGNQTDTAATAEDLTQHSNNPSSPSVEIQQTATPGLSNVSLSVVDSSHHRIENHQSVEKDHEIALSSVEQQADHNRLSLDHIIDEKESNIQSNDAIDDEKEENLQMTAEEFEEEDNTSSEITQNEFLDKYFESIQKKINPKNPYEKFKSYWIYPPVSNETSFAKAANHPEFYYYPK
ncbi:hypothetical protein, partial, partial [Parasitella parasitica]